MKLGFHINSNSEANYFFILHIFYTIHQILGVSLNSYLLYFWHLLVSILEEEIILFFLTKIIHERFLQSKKHLISKLNKNRKYPPEYSRNDIIYEKDDRRNKLAPRFKEYTVTKNNDLTVETNKRKVHKQKIHS